jgi:hypothetical protein
MRITDKGNICINGVPSTRFKAFSFDNEENIYVFDGEYSTEGYDAPDKACIDAYLAAGDESDSFESK